ncbi:MAG: biotin--[acetyl-CoA-carboxylase] ligase [Anaerolineae bacterium]|nr:biotin--[acetyl-CoA-carboxylase] ligase [Anaerolineae bacterium]
MPTDVLTADRLAADLPTRWLGRPAHVFDSLPSTNTCWLEQARQDAAEGTLAVADVQTAGKGRLGRVWQSPPGAGLLFSLLFRPAPPITPGQVMMAVVGVVDGLAAHLGVAPRLKWPNDILLDGAKLAGLLGESTTGDDGQLVVVIGCGLNVNLDPADFPPPPLGGTPATSLLVALGRPVERVPLLYALLLGIETRYDALRAGQSPYADWRRLCATLGQAVTAQGVDGVIEGVAEDVAEDGSLLVRQADGTLVSVAAGDVTLRRTAARG